MELITVIARNTLISKDEELVVPLGITAGGFLNYLSLTNLIASKDAVGNLVDYQVLKKGKSVSLENSYKLEHGDILIIIPVFSPKVLEGNLDTSFYPAGKIRFYLPPYMKIGEPHCCRVQIANDYLEKIILPDQWSGAMTSLWEAINVILKENAIVDHLAVKRLNDEAQVIELGDEEYTEWLFDVMPTRIGYTALFLEFSLMDALEGMGGKPKTICCYNQKVFIYTENRRPAEAYTSPLEYTHGLNDSSPLIHFDPEKEEELIHYISQNETGLALVLLANLLQEKDPKLFQKVVLLQAKWNESKNQFMLDLIPKIAWWMTQSKINYTVLELLNDLKLDLLSDIKHIRKRRTTLAKMEHLFDDY